MAVEERNWQYRTLITVYHGSAFGHYIEMERAWKGREQCLRQGLGQWRGLGIPGDVLEQSTALIVAAWEEHLVTRYGIQGELPLSWAGEVDPF